MRKQLLPFLFAVLLSMVGAISYAQDSQTKRTIHVETAGTLSNYISNEEKYLIEELTLTGELNGSDIKFLWDMSGTTWSYFKYEDKYYYEVYSEGKLKVLDITDTKIVEGGGWYFTWDYDESGRARYSSNNTISENMFRGCRTLTSIKLPNSVTSIGKYAFPGGLTSITIPSSVTSIKEYAFPSGLTSINVESGNQNYDSRNNCNAIIETKSNKLIAGCKSTIIPNSVTSIGSGAFSGCSGLTSVTIPNSVTSIGFGAFSGCSGLTSVTIPNSVTSIGIGAFKYCSGLTSIFVESGNAKYDSRDNCNGIIETQSNTLITGCQNTIIPSSVTSIEDYAFNGCKGLTSVTIPNSVTRIGGWNGTFYDCNSLTSIVSQIKDPFVISDYVFDPVNYSTVTLTVPYGTKTLYESTEGWKKFKNIVEASDPTTQIDYSKQPFTIVTHNEDVGLELDAGPDDPFDFFYSFDGINWYEKENDDIFINIPARTKVYIKIDNSFSDRTGFAIGDGDFDVEGNIMSLGNLNFESATTIPSSNYFANLFSGMTNLISAENLVLPATTLSEGCYNGMFRGCKSLTSAPVLPATTLAFRCYEGMFYGCTSLTKAPELPATKLEGGCYENMFYGCTNLNYIKCLAINGDSSDDWDSPTGYWLYGVAPSGTFVKASSASWGRGTSSIPSGWTVESNKPLPKRTIHVATAGTLSDLIGDDKYEIEELTLTGELNGTDIHYIRDMAGINMDKMCDGLSCEYMPTVNGQTKTSGKLRFLDLSDVTITEGGRDYYRMMVVSTSESFGHHQYTKPNSISDCMFAGCWRLEQLILPRSVSSISNAFFDGFAVGGYTYSMNINILKVAEGNPFFDSRGDCNAIIETKTNTLIAGCKTTKIPNDVTTIGNNAFWGSVGPASVIIPNNVTLIGKNAFKNCSGLTSVIIPNSVTSIGEGAFLSCSGLTSITIPNSVTSIGNAFPDCNNLKEMILSQTAYDNGIPESVTKFTTYSKYPMRVEVVSKGVVSATMKIYPIDEQGNTNENNCYTVTTSGQTPGQYIRWKLDYENYGIISEKTEGILILETLPAQAMSTTKARLSAIVNEADDDQHFGFEWLRHNAPDDMVPNKVLAPLYDGHIIGSLSGLNPDIYYKYRSFYKSDSGETIYGNWVTFLTGDANVFFEPEAHTKDATEVTSVSAQLSGVWVEGTEDIDERGFEYWTVPVSNTRAVGNDVKRVVVSGNNSSTTIEGLKTGADYAYRSYLKTASGTTYGEEKTFKTILIGDVNGDKKVNKDDLDAIVSHIMGDTPQGFNKKAADINEDDKVDAVDVVMVVNAINGK